jgi:hypothetical protein
MRFLRSTLSVSLLAAAVVRPAVAQIQERAPVPAETVQFHALMTAPSAELTPVAQTSIMTPGFGVAPEMSLPQAATPGLPMAAVRVVQAPETSFTDSGVLAQPLSEAANRSVSASAVVASEPGEGKSRLARIFRAIGQIDFRRVFNDSGARSQARMTSAEPGMLSNRNESNRIGVGDVVLNKMQFARGKVTELRFGRLAKIARLDEEGVGTWDVAVLIKEVSQYGGMHVGDRVINTAKQNSGKLTELYADGSAMIEYDPHKLSHDELLDVFFGHKPYTHVSRLGLVPEVAQYGGLRAGDNVINSRNHLTGVVKKLYADGIAVLEYGLLQASFYEPVSRLGKEVLRYGGMRVGDKVSNSSYQRGEVKRLYANGTARVEYDSPYFNGYEHVSKLGKDASPLDKFLNLFDKNSGTILAAMGAIAVLILSVLRWLTIN